MAIRSLESRFREIGGGGGEDAGRVSSDGGRRGEGRRKEEERGEVEGVSGHVYGVERCQICRARARWRVSSPVDQLDRCQDSREIRFQSSSRNGIIEYEYSMIGEV